MFNNAYLQTPSLNGDNIIFTTDDDLWSVSKSGGTARRLTTSKGHSRVPHLSPNGLNIAFISSDHGQSDIYLIPSEGGVSERLTYQGGMISISGWLDNKNLIVSSTKGTFSLRRRDLFTFNIETKEWKSLNLGEGTHYAKSGKFSLLGRNMGNPARWKRYRGGTAGTMWFDQDGKKNYRQILKNLKTNLTNPIIIDKKVFFISDHEGYGNIYSVNFSGRGIKRHTHNDEYYVRSFSHHDGELTYQSGGDIFIHDLKSSTCKRVDISVHSSFNQSVPRHTHVDRYLEDSAISTDSESILVNSRGQLFFMPPWGGAPMNLGTEGLRYRLPIWLDLPKEDNYLVMAVELNEESEETLVLFELDNMTRKVLSPKTEWGKIKGLSQSPDGKFVALRNNRNQIWLINTTNWKAELISESSDGTPGSLSWSPDGHWLAYPFQVNRQIGEIRVCDTKTKKSKTLFSSVLMDHSPSFSTCGKYLYFIGVREFHPSVSETHWEGGFAFATRPYVVVLDKDAPSPLELYVGYDDDIEEEEEDDKGKSGKTKAKTVIDFEGIDHRIIALPLPLGGYMDCVAVKDKLLYLREKVAGHNPNSARWPGESPSLYAFDLKEQKTEHWESDVQDYHVAQNGKQVLLDLGDELRLIPTEGKPTDGEDFNKKDGWIDLNRINIKINPKEEWKQMYKEAWILQREHFWTENMSNIDWPRVFKRYYRLLHKIHTRTEFSDIMWEMQGELGTSHCYEFEGDYNRVSPRYPNGFLGAELKKNSKAGLEIVSLYEGDSWIPGFDSPLLAAGVGLKAGDSILSVNGRAVNDLTQLGFELEGKANKKVNLEVKLKGKKEKEGVVVKTCSGDNKILYRQWVEKNKAYVHKKSGGRLGYVHIPDMSTQGFAEFYRNFLSECVYDGLVVDVRYNGGGNVSNQILKILAQKVVGYDQTRYFGYEPYPAFSLPGPIICVTNEHAGSDGDIFSHAFKLMKIGKLIGKRTWGGVVGIWPRNPLVDGTWTSQAEFAFWFKDVGYDVENYGTDPDIEVDITPKDYAQGKDPQLDKAIEEAIKDLRKNPPLKPALHKRPNLRPPSLPKS